MILDTFPTTEEFYKTYWGKKPFIVRGHIPKDVIESLVDGDTLAGLSLEDTIKSRFITNNKDGVGWQCEHGPFEDDHFDNLGDENWSLLVQNVEQYHTDTAQLLTHFHMSPRWLMDDIMVSFSAPGGSVGPHTDSYHTFLVQGIGKREWKISANKITDDRYADNPDMKILEHGFDGETYEVTTGDVIYMPPFFGHEGKTLEAAMTFSVGFLGPKLSEMLGDYAQYLEENENLNKRYLGETLSTNDAGFSISKSTQDDIKNNALAAFQSNDFAIWMVGYFSMTTHEEMEDTQTSNDRISGDELFTLLQNGTKLIRPEQTKITITNSSNGDFYLSAYGETILVPATQEKLMNRLNQGAELSTNDIKDDETIKFATALYNNNILTVISTDN